MPSPINRTKSNKKRRSKYPFILRLLFQITDISYKIHSSMYPLPIDWNANKMRVSLQPRNKIVIWEITYILIIFQTLFVPTFSLVTQKSSKGKLTLLENLNMAALLLFGSQNICFALLFRFSRNAAKRGLNSIFSVVDEITESKLPTINFQAF